MNSLKTESKYLALIDGKPHLLNTGDDPLHCNFATQPL